MTDEIDQLAWQAQAIANRIKPSLAGLAPAVQGAVLAELLSLWVAGHYVGGQQLMDTVLNMHFEMVRKMVPISVRELKGDGTAAGARREILGNR